MKTKHFTAILIVLALVIPANAQTSKQETKSAIQTVAQDIKVVLEHSVYSLVDEKTGKKIKEFNYTYVDKEIVDGIMVAEFKKQYGFIDMTGNLVIPYKFSKAGYFKNGKAEVETGGDAMSFRDGVKSVIDKTGNEIK